MTRDRQSRKTQDLLERLSELGIENRVNNRIDDAVQVAKPRRQHEGRRTEATVRFFQLDTHGVDDVASEEGDPTDQEDSCDARRRADQWREASAEAGARDPQATRLPRTMARVLVALRSSLADVFSRVL